MKRPMLNRSSNGGPAAFDAMADSAPLPGPRKADGAKPAVARAVVTGGMAAIPGLVDQPRAAISLPSSKSLASAVTAPLHAHPVPADGSTAGKRR
jgi:hypothetical protein